MQRDDNGQGVTEEAADPRKGYEAGKAIQVGEGLEFCHRESMTGFLRKGKTVSLGKHWVIVRSPAESYPLKNAKSHYLYSRHPRFGMMPVRLMSWFPLPVQLCRNGREWLARQLDAEALRYERRDCFASVESGRTLCSG